VSEPGGIGVSPVSELGGAGVFTFDGSIDFTLQAFPEPSTLALLAPGLVICRSRR